VGQRGYATAKVFLSYASDDRALAGDVNARLAASGHKVFFDALALEPSDGYDRLIRQHIDASHIFLFLASRAALVPGRYTLTELEMAQARWPDPHGRVLPVLLSGASFADMPSYLKGVSALQPKGDAAAEIVDRINRMAARRGSRRLGVAALALALALAAGAIGWLALRDEAAPNAAPAGPQTTGAAPSAQSTGGRASIADAETALGLYLDSLRPGAPPPPAWAWSESDAGDLFARYAPLTVESHRVLATGQPYQSDGARFIDVSLSITIRQPNAPAARELMGPVTLRETADGWRYERAQLEPVN
jgi:TIR domain